MPICYVCKKSMDKWLEADKGRKFCSESCFKQTWPKCTTCYKPMNQWITDERGKQFCSESCFSQTFPSCDCCGKKMKQWTSYENGKKYCSEQCARQSWPKCSSCGSRMNQWRETENGHKYCSESCAKTAWPKCNVCSKPMNQWITDERGKQFCSESCFSQILPVCNCCGKKMKQWLSFNDGRKYCSESCSKQSWPQCSVCNTRMNEWQETKDGKKFCSNKCLSNNLYIGAHLITPRTGYTHHGIYYGDNQVIHYSGFNEMFDNNGVVEIIALEKFKKPKDKDYGYVIKEHTNRVYFGEECVKRAKLKLGEREYCLITNNCEHFVYWCITGKEKSEQINDIVAKGGATIAGFATANTAGATATTAMSTAITIAEFTGWTMTRSIAGMYIAGAAAPLAAGYAVYKIIKWAKD